ncbi:ATP-binding protein [Streptomyces sp. 8N616]|uniref:ATP-binding protein n=1 Tax=Streptomyces sp. 8N616 TaxID=3457414 RepID=UPI003FD47E95
MTVTATARPTGHPGYAETLPCAAESAAPARALVRTALATWGLDDLVEAGVLVVTELVANSAVHTNTRSLRVTITRPTAAFVHIAVVDKSKHAPEFRMAGEGDENGRGLAIIEALTWRWGTDRLRWGKRVWAELKCGASE